MLTDDDLRALMESAAMHAPAPPPLPDDLFNVASPTPRRSIRYRSALAPVVGIAACFIVVIASISWISSLGGSSSYKSSAVARSEPSPSAANSTGTGTAAGTGGQAFNGEAQATPQSPGAQPAVPTDSARIVKNGALEIRVEKGTVSESIQRLIALATGLGGYISDTRTTATADSGSQATAIISIRVPAAAFEQLLGEASKLGDVRSTTTSGTDVTAQFTDIDAQLTALTATRDQLLTVLGHASNVGDILAVQDRITQVQVQIDQLEGQKRLLDSQASFGTLGVTLLEPGATAAAPAPAAHDNSDLGDAWRHARNSFVDGIEWIVSVSGTLALLALCGAALGGAGWFIHRWMRRRALTL